MYAGATVSNGNFAETHKINIPKDLSILNRRGYASTTRKGVPLNFRIAATVYPSGLDGSGYVTSVSSDVKTTVKFTGCQNNWVMKNAAVKWHAAREKMFRDAGVKKSSRGAYSHEIRYNFSSDSDTWAAPVDGEGNAFTGGEWEISQLAYTGDTEFTLSILGNGDDEEANAFSGGNLNMAHSYLLSRQNQLLDTNPESSEGPALHSVLHHMIAGDSGSTSAIQDDVVEEARTAQDSPPYEVLDVSASGDVQHDITEPVELGRLLMLPQGSGASLPQTTIMDVPFGLMRVLMAHRDPDDNSGITDDLALGIEVLDIFEMQG